LFRDEKSTSDGKRLFQTSSTVQIITVHKIHNAVTKKCCNSYFAVFDVTRDDDDDDDDDEELDDYYDQRKPTPPPLPPPVLLLGLLLFDKYKAISRVKHESERRDGDDFY